MDTSFNSTMIINPWLRLPSEPPYVLDIDKDDIKEFNLATSYSDYQIRTGIPPEPYLGDPINAPVMLLNLNCHFQKYLA